MHVLVPTDGSTYARLALLEAAELARSVRASISILVIASRLRMDGITPLATFEFTEAQRATELVYESPSKAEVEKFLQEGAEICRAQGIEPTLIHRHGDPAEMIIEVAEQLRPDLIVMGSHGHTGIKRFLLGSVSEKVARHAPCSVLLSRGEPFKIDQQKA